MAFWTAVVVTGGGAGVAAVALTKLLELVQHLVWPGGDLLEAASRATASRHLGALLLAGVLTGVGRARSESTRLNSSHGGISRMPSSA